MCSGILNEHKVPIKGTATLLARRSLFSIIATCEQGILESGRGVKVGETTRTTMSRGCLSNDRANKKSEEGNEKENRQMTGSE